MVSLCQTFQVLFSWDIVLPWFIIWQALAHCFILTSNYSHCTRVHSMLKDMSDLEDISTTYLLMCWMVRYTLTTSQQSYSQFIYLGTKVSVWKQPLNCWSWTTFFTWAIQKHIITLDLNWGLGAGLLVFWKKK